jgi:hypothetical protein
MIFDIPPGAQEPGTSGTPDAEFAKGGWQPVMDENKAGMRFFKVEVVLP